MKQDVVIHLIPGLMVTKTVFEHGNCSAWLYYLFIYFKAVHFETIMDVKVLVNRLTFY